MLGGLLLLSSCMTTNKIETITGNSEKIVYQNTYIKTRKYEGVIFSKDYNIWGVPISNNNFTPTIAEIDSVEIILRKGIKEINKNRLNQVGNCPVIDRKLHKYKGQYFGVVDSTGNKVVIINCFWNRKRFYDFWDKYILKEPDDNKWKTEKEMVLDGCSYHWTIKVNLRNRELFDLEVNGIG